MKVLTVEFVTSGARASDAPRDGLPQIALVGRSNVGKSSLVNALARRKVARTSAAPGKTRLLNVYRVRLGVPGRSLRGGSLYLVDLPGYGYARGGAAAARAFETLTTDYFSSGLVDGAVLALDGRHPGLASDRAAFAWLEERDVPLVLVATKIDRLSRAERRRVLDSFATSFDAPVVPVSAVTGEGLDDLWKLIAKMASRQRP